MRKLFFFTILAILILSLSGCKDDYVPTEKVNQQTVLVFMPWTGTNDRADVLFNIFQQNLDSIERAIEEGKGAKARVLVMMSQSAQNSQLFELVLRNGKVEHNIIKNYTGNFYTTSDGIAQIISDVKTHAPALNYAMMIGCHGVGWTYKDDWSNYPYEARQRPNLTSTPLSTIETMPSAQFNIDPYATTRFYGSAADMNFATDIQTLAEGISAAGVKMQYILFDDCYMANVETAYALRNVTYFLIGSTSEVMALGMPYYSMWEELVRPTPNYKGAVTAFYNFYTHYTYPYGTLTAINCQELDSLAALMREIHQKHTPSSDIETKTQALDGFSPHIFYDLGDYAAQLCGEDSVLLRNFQTQLARVVRSNAHTPSIYSYIYNSPNIIALPTTSGITISDLSTHPAALKGKEKTEWWMATHN